MAKWKIPSEPVILPVEFFATPANHNELIEWIEQYNGGEKTAAMVGAMMAWNLACSIVNASCSKCEPAQTLVIPEQR